MKCFLYKEREREHVYMCVKEKECVFVCGGKKRESVHTFELRNVFFFCLALVFYLQNLQVLFVQYFFLVFAFPRRCFGKNFKIDI